MKQKNRRHHSGNGQKINPPLIRHKKTNISNNIFHNFTPDHLSGLLGISPRDPFKTQ